MTFSIIVAAFVAASSVSVAQLQLKVTIVENRIGGRALADVQIDVDDQLSNATASNGVRVFVLHRARHGQRVQLKVDLDGYSVVNRDRLSLTLTEDPITSVTLIMCKDAKLVECYADYFGSPVLDKLIAQNKQLRKQASADAAEKKALQSEIDRVRTEVRALAAKMKGDEIALTPEAFGRVSSLAQAGKVDEAGATLQAEKLLALLQKVITAPANAEQMPGYEQTFAHAVIGLSTKVRANILSDVIQPCVEDLEQAEHVRAVCFRLGFALDDNEPEFVKAFVASASTKAGQDSYPSDLDWGWFLEKCNAEQKEHAARVLMLSSLNDKSSQGLAEACALVPLDSCTSILLGIVDDAKWAGSASPEALTLLLRVYPSPQIRNKVVAVLERRRAQAAAGRGEGSGQAESDASDLEIIEFVLATLSTDRVARTETIERIFDLESWLVLRRYPDEFATMLESSDATLTHSRLSKLFDSNVLTQHENSTVLPQYLRMMSAFAKRIGISQRELLLRAVLDRLECEDANGGRFAAYVTFALGLQPNKAELDSLASVVTAKMRAAHSLLKARTILYPHLDDSSKILLLEKPCEWFSDSSAVLAPARAVLMWSAPIASLSGSERCRILLEQISEIIVDEIVPNRQLPFSARGDIPEDRFVISHIERAQTWGCRLSSEKIALLREAVGHAELPNLAMIALYALHKLSPGALSATEIANAGRDLAVRNDCHVARLLTTMLDELGDAVPSTWFETAVRSIQAKRTSHWSGTRDPESTSRLDDEGRLLLSVVQRVSMGLRASVLTSLAETLPRLESVEAVVRTIEVLRLCHYPPDSKPKSG